MSISTIDMSRVEWLRARSNGLGGSDAAAVLGISPWKDEVGLYLDKRGETPPGGDTPKTRAGRAMEDVIAVLYEETTGRTTRRDNKIRVHPDFPFLLANLDRVISDKARGNGVLEIKNTSSHHLAYWEERGFDIPPVYYAQIQHYLLVTGWTWGELAVYMDGWDLRVIPVERDEEFITRLLAAEISFWVDHVQAGVPPEPKTPEAALTLFPRSTPGRTVEIPPDSDLLDLVLELKAHKAVVKELEAQIKPIKEKMEPLEVRLKAVIGEAEALLCGGETLITWKSNKASQRFNMDKFAAVHPDLVTEFTEEVSGARQFRVK